MRLPALTNRSTLNCCSLIIKWIIVLLSKVYLANLGALYHLSLRANLLKAKSMPLQTNQILLLWLIWQARAKHNSLILQRPTHHLAISQIFRLRMTVLTCWVSPNSNNKLLLACPSPLQTHPHLLISNCKYLNLSNNKNVSKSESLNAYKNPLSYEIGTAVAISYEF